MIKQIIILGNGFDLFLGYKTKYIDFINWIKSEKTINSNVWINFYTSNIDSFKKNYWFDFENDLANILNKDLEKHEVKIFWNNFIEIPSKIIRDKIINDWNEFKDYFLEYLLEFSNKPKIIWKGFKFWENNQIFIINFNFTKNLELKMNDKNFFVPDFKIETFQVHGDLNTGILGSDEIKNEDFQELTKKFKKFRLNVNTKKQLENFFNVISPTGWMIKKTYINVLGHSICNTDREIYDELIESDSKNNENEIIWRIFYHNDDDLDLKNLNLFKLNSFYFSGKMSRKKLEFIKFDEWEEKIFDETDPYKFTGY